MPRLKPIKARCCRLTLHPARQEQILFDLPQPFTRPKLTAAITALWDGYHSTSATRMAEAAIRDWLERGAISRMSETGLPRYRRAA